MLNCAWCSVSAATTYNRLSFWLPKEAAVRACSYLAVRLGLGLGLGLGLDAYR